MWSVEYVQVPDEKQQKLDESTSTRDTLSSAANKLAKESSEPIEITNRRRSSCNSYNGDIQTAVERLKDFKDPDYIASKQVELGSSVDSNSIFMSKLQQTIGGCEKGVIGQDIAMEREDSNVSRTSSVSDLGNPEEIGMHDNELNQDGEVVSQKSAQSVASAVEAVEMPESVPSEKPSDSASDTVDMSQPILIDLDKVTAEVRNKTHELYEEGKSPSSEFEVISEAEIKNTTSQTVEDVVRKYKKKTKNTLREGETLLLMKEM